MRKCGTFTEDLNQMAEWLVSVGIKTAANALSTLAPNVQVQHVISDITGVTGLAIVDAILAGERDTAVLAKLRDRRIKADEETIGARVESAFPAGGEWLTSRPDTDGPLSPANEGQAGAGRRNHSDGS